MMKALACVLLGAAIVRLLTGCTSAGPIATAESDHLGIEIGIRNAGRQRINLAYVRIGDYAFRAGTIVPGGRKVDVAAGLPMPDSAEVGYQLDDGRAVLKVVAIKEHMPTNVTDRIVLQFIVDGENPVGVEFLHFVRLDGKLMLLEL